MRSRIAIIAFILSAVALAASVWATVGPIVVKQDAAAVQSQAKSLADQVSEACAKGGPVAQQLGPACAKAAEVNDQPPVAQATPQPDPAALRQAARAEVAAYCAIRNGCRGTDGQSPNFDLIVDAVVAKIPAPRDGRDAPTPNYAALVAAYCGQADEPCRGAKGEKGDPPECVAEPGQCRGADGQPPAGWTTSYADGSTGTCSRAPDFDPAAPRYTCTRSAPPSTDPPLPLGG
ncbi:hypothetical protein [Amycolatopsis sp. NPDC051128]|uniref:hypothetical protein n=1 Tax=Amycolatopsis sp. NPDC051128 TaxID=3155412 RepID=UPI003426D941